MRNTSGIDEWRDRVLLKVFGMVFTSVLSSQSFAIEALPLSVTQSQIQKGAAPKQWLVRRYDKKTYELAYRVFAMSNRPELAYQVARAGVIHDLASVFWREKLAESAQWTGHLEEGLDQWVYLYKKEPTNRNYAAKILLLAPQLNNYNVKAMVLENMLKTDKSNPLLILDYANTLKLEGLPQEAMNFLQSSRQLITPTDLYKEMISLAKGTDNVPLLHEYFAKWQNADKDNVEPFYEEGIAYYLEGNLTAAMDVFEKGAAIPGPKKPDFWRQYMLIAAMMGDIKTEYAAMAILDKMNKLESSEAYRYISLLDYQGKKNEAFFRAMEIYQRNRDSQLIPLTLWLGVATHHWHQLRAFIQDIPDSQKTKLFETPENAMVLALVYQKVKLVNEAYSVWFKMLYLWPRKADIQKGWLWFLMDMNDSRRLHLALTSMPFSSIYDKKLWEPISAALLQLNEKVKALAINIIHIKEVRQDFRKLIELAGIWDQFDQNFLADKMQREALYQLLFTHNYHGVSLFRREMALVYLFRAYAPMEVVYRSLAYLERRHPRSASVKQEVLAFALQKENNSLARHAIHLMERSKHKVPSWMLLTVSLQEMDLPLMQKVLSLEENQIIPGSSPLTASHDNVTPYRDRVMAYTRLGKYTKAETYAYQGLSDHQRDYLMYDLFTETMLRRSNYVSADIKYLNFSGIKGPISDIKGRTFVTPSVALMPYVWLWKPSKNNNLVLETLPAQDFIAGSKIHWLRQRGYIEAYAAGRNSVETTMMLGAKWHSDFMARWDGDISVDYHERSVETAQLMVAGMQNKLEGRLGYIYDQYNHFEVQTNLWQYYGQDSSYLGRGKGIEGHWTHRLFLTDPDWNTNLYLVTNHMNATNQPLSSTLLQFVPIDQREDATSAFYMPVSYNQVVYTVGFGQHYREDYTARIRPFAEAGLSYTDAFGLGKIFSLGLTGKIFGRDKLLLYADYADNTLQSTQSVYSFGVRYVINF